MQDDWNVQRVLYELRFFRRSSVPWCALFQQLGFIIRGPASTRGPPLINENAPTLNVGPIFLPFRVHVFGPISDFSWYMRVPGCAPSLQGFPHSSLLCANIDEMTRNDRVDMFPIPMVSPSFEASAHWLGCQWLYEMADGLCRHCVTQVYIVLFAYEPCSHYLHSLSDVFGYFLTGSSIPVWGCHIMALRKKQ